MPSLRVGAVLLVVGVIFLAASLVPSTGYGAVGGTLAWLGWLLSVTLLVLAAAEAFELIELAAERDSRDGDEQPGRPAFQPFVSFHVPICSEPPEVVAQTLMSLRALRYEQFEVLVIDNNTADEALWRPVERLCLHLGPRFRFFHLARWPGYKAGALNFALAHTSPEACVVGVVDSDYEVAADFPASLAAHFADDRIGFVQAPQDYREWEARHFTRMCYWEYWQFFAVSMRLRRPRNAILMHGTMVMVRRSALLGVGGWSEWCLTEDSELGLRLLASGYRGVYSHKTYGRGLVPFSYQAYRRQRQRWVTGGAQAVRRHWRLFLPWSRALTASQKMHYLQGWAPWLRDAVFMVAMPLMIVLGVFSVAFAGTPGPLLPLSTAVLTVTTYLAIRQALVYRAHLRRPWADGVGAGLAIFGLVMTVGGAWLRAWLGARVPFHRTPKRPQPTSAGRALASGELVSGVVMAALTLSILLRFGVDGAYAAAGPGAYVVLFLASAYVELADQRTS